MKTVPIPRMVGTLEQVRHYADLFVGRWSDFAIQIANGGYVRAGRPLELEDLLQHFRGLRTLGSYLMDDQGLCRCCVYDDDRETGLLQLLHLQEVLRQHGYASYLERSRRGGHLWVFFEELVPASQVRDWFLPFCPSGVEFYPKQSEGGAYGSLIRLPLGVHKKSGQCYPFFFDDEVYALWRGVDDQLHRLMSVERNPVPSSRKQPLTYAGVTPTLPQHQSLAPTALTHLTYSQNTIRSWCEMQDPFAVIGRYVQLDQRGMACCPFGSHHQGGRDLHPSFKVYQPKRVGGSSWFCYTWNRGGNVFDFLCSWYNVDAATMWRRIQAGEV